MHELSLAQDMVEQITQAAEREKASRISRVVVVIGSYSGVEPDAFAFAFPFAAENTPAEGAELIIEKIAATAFCHRCHAEITSESLDMVCTKCGSSDITIQGGREFLIRSIDLEIS